MARKTGSSGEKTARELRVAATKLFARHGYAAVSMRQIAAEVGVQAGALYLYTPDKQSLLFDLMHNHMLELLEELCLEQLNNHANAADQLDAFVRFHIRFHLKRVDAVFINYMELRNLSDENLTVITNQRQEYENFLKHILLEGVEQKSFDLQDVKLTTYAIIAMLTGINTWYSKAGRLDSKKVVTIYLDLVRGVVARNQG